MNKMNRQTKRAEILLQLAGTNVAASLIKPWPYPDGQPDAKEWARRMGEFADALLVQMIGEEEPAPGLAHANGVCDEKTCALCAAWRATQRPGEMESASYSTGVGPTFVDVDNRGTAGSGNPLAHVRDTPEYKRALAREMAKPPWHERPLRLEGLELHPVNIKNYQHLSLPPGPYPPVYVVRKGDSGPHQESGILKRAGFVDEIGASVYFVTDRWALADMLNMDGVWSPEAAKAWHAQKDAEMRAKYPVDDVPLGDPRGKTAAEQAEEYEARYAAQAIKDYIQTAPTGELEQLASRPNCPPGSIIEAARDELARRQGAVVVTGPVQRCEGDRKLPDGSRCPGCRACS